MIREVNGRPFDIQYRRTPGGMWQVNILQLPSPDAPGEGEGEYVWGGIYPTREYAEKAIEEVLQNIALTIHA